MVFYFPTMKLTQMAKIKSNIKWQKSTNRGGPSRGFTVTVEVYSSGDLLTICSSRVGAYSRGAFSRGINSRIYGIRVVIGLNYSLPFLKPDRWHVSNAAIFCLRPNT